jgi:hypothetical protein
MIKFHLDRHYDKHQTKGNLLINKEGASYQCKTLELPWKENKSQISCIPEGTYPVKIRYSKKYGTHLHITDVPNRDLILIHWANYVGSNNPKSGHPDLLGCVGVGERYGDITKDGIDELLNSKNIFDKMMNFIKDELGEMEIEICGNGGEYSPKV